MGLLQWTQGVIDELNRRVGLTVAWLTLGMVLTQFTVVVARYVFSKGSIPAQETIWYMHGLVFMVGAGYTLLRDGHVRVDVFYRERKPATKATIDLLGVILFLMPVCVFTFDAAWDYVLNAWAVKEKSTETNGIPAIFLLKMSIWLAIGLLGLQALSMAVRSAAVLVKENVSLARTVLVGLAVAMVPAANRVFYAAEGDFALVPTLAALVALVSQVALAYWGRTVRAAVAHAVVMVAVGIVLFYCSTLVEEWAAVAAKIMAVWSWMLAVVSPGVSLATSSGRAGKAVMLEGEAPNELEEPHPPAFVGRDMIVGIGIFLIPIEALTAVMLNEYMHPWLLPMRIGIIAVLYLATLMRMNGARLALVAALLFAAGETLHYAAIASGDVGALTTLLAYGNIVTALVLICSPGVATYMMGRASDFETVISTPARTLTTVLVGAVFLALIVAELEVLGASDTGLLPPPLRSFVVFALPVGIYVGSRVASWLSVLVLAAAAAFLVGEIFAPGEASAGAMPALVGAVALALCAVGAVRGAASGVHATPADLPPAGGPDHARHVPALAAMGAVLAFLAAFSIAEYSIVPWHVTGIATPLFLIFVGAVLLYGAYQGRWLASWIMQVLLIAGAYFALRMVLELSSGQVGDELRFYVDMIYPPPEGADAEGRPIPAAAITWLWVAVVGFVASAAVFALPPVLRFQAAQREARRQAEGTRA